MGRQLSDGLLAAYLGELDADGISPATISLTVSAVKWWFRLKKIPMPFDLTDLKLKTIHLDNQGRGRGRVAPLRHDEVERICWEACKEKNPLAGLRDLALVRTMRDGLLRVSERVAVDVEHLQDKRCGFLDLKQIKRAKERSCTLRKRHETLSPNTGNLPVSYRAHYFARCLNTPSTDSVNGCTRIW